MSDIPPLSFEEVFRFRAPTPEQVEDARNATIHKFSSNGHPVGTQAYFSVPELQSSAMEYITFVGDGFAEKHGISEEDAHKIVQSGFIGALEFLATLRQQAED